MHTTGPVSAVLGTVCLLALCAFTRTTSATEPLIETMRDAQYIGADQCIACHRDTNQHFAHTAHAKVFVLAPHNELEARNCEACHGPGSLHQIDPLAKGKIIGFSRGSGIETSTMNGQCLQCHRGQERMHWPGSMHELQGLACSDCHNPMAKLSAQGLQRKPAIAEACYGCHQQQRLQFNKQSHMPLPEGKMTCTDCHNPHGSTTQSLLKAETVNDTCYQCHAEKRGPFLWEHAPVRENCLNCHNPHGSNHEYLLTTARPFLCQQCHSPTRHPNDLFTTGNLANGAFPDERLINRSCQNCHAQVHGSNHPSGVRQHR